MTDIKRVFFVYNKSLTVPDWLEEHGISYTEFTDDNYNVEYRIDVQDAINNHNILHMLEEEYDIAHDIIIDVDYIIIWR